MVSWTAVTGLVACGGGGSARLGDAIDGPVTADAEVSSSASNGPHPGTSCLGVEATCGPTGDAPCCGSPLVPGGTFFRSYDGTPDYNDRSFPATVSPFRLDRYEVSIGRFRQFVNAGMGTQASPPLAGAGAHATLADSGWDPAWNERLSADTAALVSHLACGQSGRGWTDVPGSNENLPVNCVTWLEAMAFCAWDDGYLPTEAEWNFAAAGGSEQRQYPWPNTPDGQIDCSYAEYASCPGYTGRLQRVGHDSPKGDGRWGQSDLAGNVVEYTLDWDTEPYTNPCTDCATVIPSTPPLRMIRGGQWGENAYQLRTSWRDVRGQETVSSDAGIRCARAP